MSKDTDFGELDKFGGERLPDLVRRFTAHKNRSERFVSYLREHFYELGANISLKQSNLRDQIPKVDECGSYLMFRNYYLKNDTRLISANFCKKHTLCGLCAVRRAAKGAENLHDKAEKILSERPELNAYFIVLTVKNEPDLGYAMRKLKKGWKRIKWTIRDARRARKTQNPEQSKYASALNSEFADVAGGVYSIEVTYNEEQETWHPHMNLLVLSETEMSNEKVSQEWKKKTGDSFITHCEEKDPVNDKGVVCEIMKYSMKFSELPFEQNKDAYLALLGQQLKGTIGDFRGVDLEPDPADETLEGEPYIEILYSYYNGNFQESGERIAGVEKPKESSTFVQSDLIPN